MAKDILILSPSYQKAALPGTRERNALLAECLTDDYLFFEDDVHATIARMREKGYDKPLTKDMASEGRMRYRSVYRYYNSDTDDPFRKRVDAHISDGQKRGEGRGRYLGIACLLKDRQDIHTWEDMERALAAAGAGEEKRTDDEIQESEARQEYTGAPDALAGAESPLEAVLTQIAQTGEMMRRIASDLSAYIGQQRQQAEHDQKRIADLQRENAYLRQRMEQWLTQSSAVVESIAAVQDLGTEVAYRILLATYNLPEKTRASLSGGQKELSIVYSRERGAFCDRLQSDMYSKAEKNQVAKAIRFLAQFGPRHSSLHTELFRRPLPGTPDDIGDFFYSRASEDLRFTHKEIRTETGEAVTAVFCIYKHTSGAKSSLPDIR